MNYDNIEGSDDSNSLINSLVKKSKEVQDNVELDDDCKVLISRKILAKVISDHFKFYDILHR